MDETELPKPAPGEYTVRHAVKPFGADHWQLILEGYPDGHQDVLTDYAFKSGDRVRITADGPVELVKQDN